MQPRAQHSRAFGGRFPARVAEPQTTRAPVPPRRGISRVDLDIGAIGGSSATSAGGSLSGGSLSGLAVGAGAGARGPDVWSMSAHSTPRAKCPRWLGGFFLDLIFRFTRRAK
jgi:hypothetical protein